MEHLVNLWAWLNNNLLAILIAYTVAMALGASRSLGGILSSYTSPIAVGWWYHRCASNPNIINVTLNMVEQVEGKLSIMIDTIVADKTLREVWKNPFIAHAVFGASKTTQIADSVIKFTDKTGWLNQLFRHLTKREVHDLYKQVYNPLVSQISEKTNNIFSFMKAVGIPMVQHDFVVSLHFEKGIAGRDEHWRCMMTAVTELKNLPDICPAHLPPYMQTRFKAMQHAKQAWQTEPERVGIVSLFLPIGWRGGQITTLLGM